MFAVAGKRGVLLFGGSSIDCAHAQAGAQECAGLGAVNGLEKLRVGRLAFAFQIGHLPGNHAAHGAGSGGQLGDEAHFGAVRDSEPGKRFEGQGEKRVSGQNRHGFAEHLMTGELAAAVVVVIESRQVVVDQRIGVDELQGAGGGDHAVRRIRNRARRLHA